MEENKNKTENKEVVAREGGRRRRHKHKPNHRPQEAQKQAEKQVEKQSQKQQPKPQKQQNVAVKEKQADKAQARDNKKDENRKDTYLYTLDGNLYVNLTNKCSNGCDFCVRNERASYYGNYLWLRHGDPTAEKVMAAANGFGDLSRFKEVVI